MKTGAAAGTDCRMGARTRPWARAGGQAGDKRLKSPFCWRSIRSLYPPGDWGQFLAIMMNGVPIRTVWIQHCFKNIVYNQRTTREPWPQSWRASFISFNLYIKMPGYKKSSLNTKSQCDSADCTQHRKLEVLSNSQKWPRNGSADQRSPHGRW